VGFQAGIESTDVVLIFRNRKSLDRVLSGKDKLTLGVDASVAAGPIGRDALAATDAQLGAEVLSYSRARGLFAGVSIDGAVIRTDPYGNAMFKSPRAEELKLIEQLKGRLADLSRTSARPVVPDRPSPILQPPTSPKRPRLRPFRPWRRQR
jgi:lipid-binding SYLF domain-containing protein